MAFDEQLYKCRRQPDPLLSYRRDRPAFYQHSNYQSNQEYSLDVSFDYMGPTELSDSFIKKTTEEVNATLPVGFRTTNTSYGWYNDRGTQYWLILLIVVIIFFTCSILFESLRQPLVIISLIPISFIGTFLTFYFPGLILEQEVLHHWFY